MSLRHPFRLLRNRFFIGIFAALAGIGHFTFGGLRRRFGDLLFILMTESFFTLFFILVSAAGAGINDLAGLLAGGLCFLHCIGMSQCRFSLFRLSMSADRAGISHLAGFCAGRLRGRSVVIHMISLRDLLIIRIPAYSTGKCLDPCLFAGGFPCEVGSLVITDS